MGRNKRKGGHPRRHEGTPKIKDDAYRTDIIDKSDMENERFSTYYKAQNIVPEDEWVPFLNALRDHLPTTFRVAGSRQVANSLNSTIKSVHVPSLSNVIFEGQPIPPPVQIPWYPEGLAWQFNVPKKVLRKSPEFKKFHSFLVFETEVGNISRQEAVSMLPPLFLDVQPHHKVMDMCAAPGSKTAQLLEALHAHDSVTSTSIPTGLLLANDSDHRRTHLLIHQSARLPSPALMVTNLDASIYPTIKVPASVDSGNKKLEHLLFDRILCDVPCSGDGTMRKNMGIWKNWQPMDGNGLHSLQVRILQRAIKLLAAGGRIVYSTCSMNPVENEAVISEVLMANPDFGLVDVSSTLPELKRRSGLTTWRPCTDRDVTTSHVSYEAYVASSPNAKSTSKLTEGHWPPKEIETLNISRCLRIYPHLQDSGGFFVAVLERKSKVLNGPSTNLKERKREADELNEVPETKKPRLHPEAPSSKLEARTTERLSTELKLETDTSAKDPSQSSIVREGEKDSKPTDGGGSFKEHPYTFLDSNDPILHHCIKRLHLTSNFPSSNVLVRNPEGDAVRSLYLVNDLVKAIVVNNDYSRIRLTAAGTKVFSKQEAGKGIDAQFRVLGEGLPVVLPYVEPSTIITADLATLKILIESYYPLCSSFSEPFRATIAVRPVGNHIVKFAPGEAAGAKLTHDIVLPIWKSNVSLSLMMDKKAKSALSLRLFGSDTTVAGRDAAAQQKKSSDTMITDSPSRLSPRVEEVDVAIDMVDGL